MKEKILGVVELAKTRKFTIQGVDIDFGNGKKKQFERLKFTGTGRGVVAIPLVKENDRYYIYMIDHFCVGSEKHELLLPGGHREVGDTLEQAINRELQEEIGFKSQNISFLLKRSSPGYILGESSFCLAQDLVPNPIPGDEVEEIAVKKVCLEKLREYIQDGTITDSKTLVGLLYLKSFYNFNNK